MMSVGAEVPSAGENQPVNPNNSAWDVRPFMVPPLGEMKKGVPVLHGGKQFSEPGPCGHYHTAMWPVKGQQSAVRSWLGLPMGSALPWPRPRTCVVVVQGAATTPRAANQCFDGFAEKRRQAME